MKYFHTMKYIIILSCFIPVALAGFGQKIKVNVQYLEKTNQFESDTIFYSPDRKLIWSDYKEVNNPSSVTGALTSANIGYIQEVNDQDGKISIDIKVFTYFQKSNSWRKPATMSSLALSHEQRHFDLTYLSALRFVDYLKKAKFKEKNYRNLVNSVYIRVFKENDAVQQAYDQATEHGSNVQGQIEWNKNINEMLEKQLTKEKEW